MILIIGMHCYGMTMGFILLRMGRRFVTPLLPSGPKFPFSDVLYLL